MATNTFSRHHALVVALLLFVLILGVTAYVLQRNEGIKTVAGEAFRQRASPPPANFGLAPSPSYPNQEPVIIYCPKELSSVNQHWNLPGWKLVTWQPVASRCEGIRMTCYYADPNVGEPVFQDPKYLHHADYIAFYQDILINVTKCGNYGTVGLMGCACYKGSGSVAQVNEPIK